MYWQFSVDVKMFNSEVACCAPACVLSISNLLSLLCCKTDYLFCYLLINVILLLKATACCIVLQKVSFLSSVLEDVAESASQSQQQPCCRRVGCIDALHQASMPAWLTCTSDVIMAHPQTRSLLQFSDWHCKHEHAHPKPQIIQKDFSCTIP